jgi:Protein of unknown function (DUF4239)
MSYAAAVSTILIAGVVAAFATALIQRCIGIDLRRHHHDVGSVVFLQLGVVFAVLLAFVFSEAWGQYNEAAQAIDLEVSAMHGVGVIAATLAPAQANRMLAKERAYLESVAYHDWPIMARSRTEDIATDHKLEVLIQDAANLRLTDSDQQDKKAEILSLLTQAHTQREMRIFQASSGIPVPLWSVLIASQSCWRCSCHSPRSNTALQPSSWLRASRSALSVSWSSPSFSITRSRARWPCVRRTSSTSSARSQTFWAN